ncbi:unnamed protein product [Notodromas monacha]|uniref:Uncharacterized protein n=1 Tax=Notodromas monacha TaxID=399045 RepID=A0A7R9BME6_9CRUS|nr:unnamed protein product [Notodromas monacha]CAG0918194.1 unnamed protein product [Notodromas monacha]
MAVSASSRAPSRAFAVTTGDDDMLGLLSNARDFVSVSSRDLVNPETYEGELTTWGNVLCPGDEIWTLLHLCFAILTESLGLHCLTAEFCLAYSADSLEAVGIMEALLLTFLVFKLNRSITSVVEAVAIAGMSIGSKRYAGALGGALLLLAELFPFFRDYDFLAVALANPLLAVALSGKGVKEYMA